MALSTKAVFWGITLVYVLMVGLLAGNSFDNAWQLWLGNEDTEQLRYQEPTFQMAAAAGATLVVLIQVCRIAASIRRDGAQTSMTTRNFWLGWQFNLQMKLLFVVILIWGAAWLKSKF